MFWALQTRLQVDLVPAVEQFKTPSIWFKTPASAGIGAQTALSGKSFHVRYDTVPPIFPNNVR